MSYACSNWAIIPDDGNKLNVFERKVLSKIYGPVHNHDTQVWERRSNEQRRLLYGKRNMGQFKKGAILELAGHVRKPTIL